MFQVTSFLHLVPASCPLQRLGFRRLRRDSLPTFISLPLTPNIFFCLSPPPNSSLPTFVFILQVRRRHHLPPRHDAVRHLHPCHVPSKGYMAHFLISCIVGYLGSQACLLESYLYPPPRTLMPLPPPLLGGQPLSTLFFSLSLSFAFNRIKMKGRTNATRSKRKREGGGREGKREGEKSGVP